MKTLLVILIALIVVLIIVAISLYKLGKEFISSYSNFLSNTTNDKNLRELVNVNTGLINKNRSTFINNKDEILAAIKEHHCNISKQLDEIYKNTTKTVRTKKSTKTETK